MQSTRDVKLRIRHEHSNRIGHGRRYRRLGTPIALNAMCRHMVEEVYDCSVHASIWDCVCKRNDQERNLIYYKLYPNEFCLSFVWPSRWPSKQSDRVETRMIHEAYLDSIRLGFSMLSEYLSVCGTNLRRPFRCLVSLLCLHRESPLFSLSAVSLRFDLSAGCNYRSTM